MTTAEGGGPLGCLFVCSPDGPGTPFATPTLMLFDAVRVLVIALGVLTLVGTPKAMARCTVAGQYARFLGQAAFSVTALSTEYEHLGDDASARLLFNVVGVLLMAYGLWSFLYREDPAHGRGQP